MTSVTSALPISPACLDRDYDGCGRAWAAVQDGQVIALRYMGHHRLLGPNRQALDLPAWVTTIRDAADGCDNHMLPTAHSSRGLSRLAAAASACDDCPRPPRRARVRPTELLAMARAAIVAADEAEFLRYRAACRAELAALGQLVSGMASCCEFVPR
jgi:hypothetical protein